MSLYQEGLELLEEMFGKQKDNVIALATIALEQSADGKPCPAVRGVDAYYENGTFYVVTYAKSNKMLQVAQNHEVSISSCALMFSASGTAENLGWVRSPKNAEIRTKLRTVFAAWYDMANNEDDENCCILAIHLTKGIININHWEKLYYMDFVNQTCTEKK